MVDSIKITALTDIGANIAYTSLVPVVNMAGTPITQKSNLQNLGNLILNGAGGSYFARAAQANLALSVVNAAQPNITSVGTLTSLAVTGNINAGNVNGGNIIVANYYYGDGGFLTNVSSGSNYSNSNVANYLPTYTGNVGANWVIASYFMGNGHNLTYLPGGNVVGAVASATTSGTVTTAAQPNITSVGTLTGLSVNGTVTAVNITANTGVFTGNGSGLTNLTGANVTGTVANAAYAANANEANTATSATIAGTVTTAAQPNITSIGTLSNLNVSGNTVVGGNLTVGGNLVYVNVETLAVNDPIIDLQTGPNGAAPVANSGKDVGTALNYYDTQARVAFMGWDVSNAEFGMASQATIASEVVTFGTYGNLRVGNIIGNGQALTGLSGANVSGTVANATYAVSAGSANSATTAGTVTTNAQPNITSVGTLTGLTVNGNVTANYFNGVATDVVVEAVNNNYSYHMAFVTGSGDTTLHMDNDDNLQYNPADGVMTVTRVDAGYLGASEGILTNLIPFDSLSLSLGNATNPWQDLYLSNSTLYIGDATITANGNSIVVDSITVNNGNIGTVGNIASINLDGSSSNVLYGNGVFAPASGGGGNTGNVTFDDVTVQGVNGLNLSAGADFTANLAYLQVRAGDVPSHIHLDTGNNEAYDLIVGDDQNYVQVSSTGNILLSSYDSNTAQYTWTLDYNGNLILAGGNGVIQSIANSSLDPLNPNVSTMVLTPDANYNSQVLVLDPTAPGHIHLRAYAFSNIDEPAANIFLGGEDTAFEVTQGANNQARIHSGGNEWTFDSTGNLILPGSSGGFIKTLANSSIGIAAMDNGTNNPAQLLLLDAGTGNAATIVSAYNSNATIQTDVSGNIKTWSFNDDGTLSLPNSDFGYAQLYTTGANLYLGNSNNPINIQADGTISSNGAISANNIGNVAAANFDGNAGNILYGNGIFAAAPGGGGGAVISNGTSYANVVASNGNVVIGVDSNNMTWTFATDRKIYGLMDENVTIAAINDGNDPSVYHQVTDNSLVPVSQTRLESGDFSIGFDLDGNANIWNFDRNSLRPPTGGAFEQYDGNIRMYAMDAGSNPVASLQSVSNQNDPNIFSTFDATTTGANISVYNGGSNGGTGYTWRFDNNGVLTLPGNTAVIEGSANLVTIYSDSGSSLDYLLVSSNNVTEVVNQGNVQITSNNNGTSRTWEFDSNGTLTTPGDITVAGDITGTAGANTLVLKAQPTTDTYIQLNSIVDSIVSTAANLEIVTDSSNTSKTWTFDNNGDFTVPNYIKFVGNSFIGDETSGNIFRIAAPLGYGIILETDADISGNNYQFDFGSDGNLTAPGDVNVTGNISATNIGNVAAANFDGNAGNVLLGNGVFSGLPSPTSIVNGTSNVSVANNGNVTVGVAGTANVVTATSTGANITGTLNVTGNVTAQGVGTNLVRRAYGSVAADTAVVLDNIEAFINSGTNQLYIYLNSGTWQATGVSETFQGGGPANQYWVNVPISSTGSPNGFAMSGAMGSQSYMTRLTFSDQDNLDKMYRVTVIRAGTSGNLWNISIERLV